MKLSPSVKSKILILVQHITAYADLIYSNARTLERPAFIDYFKPIVAESTEIKKIVLQTFADTESSDIFSSLFREETARRLYIIKYLLIALPANIENSGFFEFEDTIGHLSAQVNELLLYLSRVLDISTEHLEQIPIADLQNASDYSLTQYLEEMPDRIQNTSQGTTIFAGTPGESTAIIRSMMMHAGYHTVVCGQNEKIESLLEMFDVNLVCYDCADVPDPTFKEIENLLRNHPTCSIPVFICGNVYHEDYAVTCISMGAVDYFSPLKNRKVLFSRITTAIRMSRQNYRRQLYIRALELNQHSTAHEFIAAESYVSSLLPRKITDGSVQVDWTFMPSLDLGGDIFGYSWLDKNKFAVYLLDVSGHGLEACLYSVTIMNLLKHKLLHDADFTDPAGVLTELNRIFDIETQNNMFFTAWYGVYDCTKRELVFSTAGSQYAVLFSEDGTRQLLCGEGTVIGVDSDSVYENTAVRVESNSRMYIFSDGIYEIKKEDDSMLELDEFIDMLAQKKEADSETCLQFARRVELTSKNSQFDDDVSLLEVTFS